MYPIKIKAHDRNVNIIRFNYDGDLIFSGAADRLINVFQAFTGQLLGSYNTNVAVKTLDVDRDSRFLVYGSFDGTIQIFNVTSGEKLLSTNLSNNISLCKIYHLEFDLTSRKLLVLHEYQMNGHIKIIDFDHVIGLIPDIKNEKKVIQGSSIKILHNYTLKFQQGSRVLAEKAKWYVDNKSFFVGTNEGDVMHIAEEGKLIKKASIHPNTKIKSVAFSNDFSVLATAANDGCKVLNPETLQILRVFKQEHPMNDVSISPLFNHPIKPKHHIIFGGGVDAKTAAQTKGAGFDAHLCDVMFGRQIGKVLTHFSPISSIQFFKDGLGYVSCGDDSYVVIVRFEQNYLNDTQE